MYFIRDEDLDLNDFSKMTLRKIGFEFDHAQFSVTKALRLAWTFLPPTPDGTDLGELIRKYNSKTGEEKSQTPRNPDTKTVHTPLRDSVYYMFNHLFFDVGNFMKRIRPFFPPNHDAFGLKFPQSEKNEDAGRVRALTKTWETAVLVLPAYLAPEVSVRVETASVVDDGVVIDKATERANFSHEQPTCGLILYIVRGVETHFYVETTGDVNVDGLAAAIVYGKFEGKQESNMAEEEMS